MPIDVFLMVLGAALVHATWNALVKADGDRLSFMKIMVMTQAVMALLLLPFVAFPAAEAWPYLIASAVVSIGYVLFLIQAYGSGDLSHAYPLARGIAPLIVAAVSVMFLGEQLSRPSQIAILLVGIGITSLSLARGAEGLRDLRMVGFALGTGGFIAAYTLLDGVGARAAGSAHGYTAWISLISCSLITAALTWLQKRNGTPPVTRRTRIAGVTSGLASYGSTWAIIWAMTMVPVPLVSALRETSIVFAVLIGVVFLKERLNLARLASIAATLIGTAILKFSR
jgi:drug/metabolite transporter (DMT)-like permease